MSGICITNSSPGITQSGSTTTFSGNITSSGNILAQTIDNVYILDSYSPSLITSTINSLTTQHMQVAGVLTLSTAGATTVASGATLEFKQGGSLSCATGGSIIIQGNIVAPATQIFTTSGTCSVTWNSAEPIVAAWFGNTDLGLSAQAADSACATTAAGGNGGIGNCTFDWFQGWGGGATLTTSPTLRAGGRVLLGPITYTCANASGCFQKNADGLTIQGVNSGNPAANGTNFVPVTHFVATADMNAMYTWASHIGNGSSRIEDVMFDGGSFQVTTGCTLTKYSNVLSGCTAAHGGFSTTYDVGKPLQISGCTGCPFTPTIVKVDSATQVELNVNWTGTTAGSLSVTEPYAQINIQMGSNSTSPLLLGERLDNVALRNAGTGILVEGSASNFAQNLDIYSVNCGDNSSATNPVAVCLDASLGPMVNMNVIGGRLVAVDEAYKIGPDSTTSSHNTSQAIRLIGVDVETIGNAARHNGVIGNVYNFTQDGGHSEWGATNSGQSMYAWGNYGTGTATTCTTATNMSTALSGCSGGSLSSCAPGQAIRVSGGPTASPGSALETWISSCSSGAGTITLAAVWPGASTTTGTISAVFNGGSPEGAKLLNVDLVDDTNIASVASWANATLYPEFTGNTCEGVNVSSDVITDHATNSFGDIGKNPACPITGMIDSGANLQNAFTTTGAVRRDTEGGFLDTGNFAYVKDFFTSTDGPNAVSVTNGANVHPMKLSFGVNQASLYTEIQGWQSEIGYNYPLHLQRQGGTVVIDGLTTNGVVSVSSGVLGSKQIAGSGAAITSGPSSSTSGDCVSFAAGGQIQDGGGQCAQENLPASGASITFSPTATLNTVTLSANATISIGAGTAGFRSTFLICQSTGPYTLTWPATVHGGMTIGSTLYKCSSQDFVYSSDQAGWFATSPGVINE